jgi:hypothetical protein
VAAPLQLRFALTRAEYVAGTGTGANRAVRAGLVLGFGLFAAGLAAKIELLIGLGITAAVVGLAALALPYWRWSVSPALHDEEDWTIDDKGCQVERADSRTRNGWSHYRELIDGGSVYVLLDQRGSADLIPKRALASEQDEAAFVDLARAHVAVRERDQAASSGWTD